MTRTGTRPGTTWPRRRWRRFSVPGAWSRRGRDSLGVLTRRTMPAFKNPIAVSVLVALCGLATAADAPARVPGFDPTAIDRSTPACADFYQFACGNWTARNTVPPDRARWGRFDELAERNQAALRGILEKVS